MVKKTPENSGEKRLFAGKPGPGRPKGCVNKSTAMLKDAVLQAAQEAGGEGGMVGYLTRQASENPAAFMSLLGKILPTQVEGSGEGGAIVIKWQD